MEQSRRVELFAPVAYHGRGIGSSTLPVKRKFSAILKIWSKTLKSRCSTGAHLSNSTASRFEGMEQNNES